MMSKKLISFSLFGTSPFYLDAAVHAAANAQDVFPGYTPRFYVSQEIEAGLITRLQDMGAEVVHKERKAEIDGMFWRFLATADPQAALVMVRDVDAYMGDRDQQANDAWLASGKDYHIVRDDIEHDIEILGGLWACRGEKIPHIAKLIDNFPMARQQEKGGDQTFLSLFVYPWIKDRAFIQSDNWVYTGEQVHPCPPFTAKPKYRCMCSPDLVDDLRPGQFAEGLRQKGTHILRVPDHMNWQRRFSFKVSCLLEQMGLTPVYFLIRHMNRRVKYCGRLLKKTLRGTAH